jgi:hypothetical protein
MLSPIITYDFFAVLLNEGSTKQRRPVFSHREHGAGNLSWTLHLTFSCQICRQKERRHLSRVEVSDLHLPAVDAGRPHPTLP